MDTLLAKSDSSARATRCQLSFWRTGFCPQVFCFGDPTPVLSAMPPTPRTYGSISNRCHLCVQTPPDPRAQSLLQREASNQALDQTVLYEIPASRDCPDTRGCLVLSPARVLSSSPLRRDSC